MWGFTAYQGFQFRPANSEFRQTFSFNPTQIRQSFYVYIYIIYVKYIIHVHEWLWNLTEVQSR